MTRRDKSGRIFEKLGATKKLIMETAIIAIIAIFVYFLPTIAGWKKKNAVSIFVVNLFLGWTLIGWVVALAWGLSKDKV
jgi:hypothetical protein